MSLSLLSDYFYVEDLFGSREWMFAVVGDMEAGSPVSSNKPDTPCLREGKTPRRSVLRGQEVKVKEHDSQAAAEEAETPETALTTPSAFTSDTADDEAVDSICKHLRGQTELLFSILKELKAVNESLEEIQMGQKAKKQRTTKPDEPWWL